MCQGVKFVSHCRVVVLCIVCVEFVALAIGTHRDTKDNPVVMKSYIPSPDYGWYSAVLSSLFWLCIWGAHRRDPRKYFLAFTGTLVLDVLYWSIYRYHSETFLVSTIITREKKLEHDRKLL